MSQPPIDPIPDRQPLRQATHALVWLLWLPLAILGLLLKPLRGPARRIHGKAWHLALLLPLPLLWIGIPLAYGRFALLREIQVLARRGGSEADLRPRLQHLAARAGLVHPLPPPEAFEVLATSHGADEGLAIRFAFPQDLRLLGFRLGSLELSGQVESLVQPAPPPKRPEDLVD